MGYLLMSEGVRPEDSRRGKADYGKRLDRRKVGRTP
jgi:hypothetical protein